jgi:hypothetical protein
MNVTINLICETFRKICPTLQLDRNFQLLPSLTFNLCSFLTLWSKRNCFLVHNKYCSSYSSNLVMLLISQCKGLMKISHSMGVKQIARKGFREHWSSIQCLHQSHFTKRDHQSSLHSDLQNFWNYVIASKIDFEWMLAVISQTIRNFTNKKTERSTFSSSQSKISDCLDWKWSKMIQFEKKNVKNLENKLQRLWWNVFLVLFFSLFRISK